MYVRIIWVCAVALPCVVSAIRLSYTVININLKKAHRRGVVSDISGARAMARDIGSVGNNNALVLLVFIISELVCNSSIE